MIMKIFNYHDCFSSLLVIILFFNNSQCVILFTQIAIIIYSNIKRKNIYWGAFWANNEIFGVEYILTFSSFIKKWIFEMIFEFPLV